MTEYKPKFLHARIHFGNQPFSNAQSVSSKKGPFAFPSINGLGPLKVLLDSE